MVQEQTTPEIIALTSVASRQPGKTFRLGQVFNDTTNSYKIVWFMAILAITRRGTFSSLKLSEIFAEMAVVAWHPVCLYRLSLGQQDKLQDAVLSIQKESGLPANADAQPIRAFIDGSPTARAKLEFLGRYVPTRFLSPWFAEQLRGHPTEPSRARESERLAKASQNGPDAAPYWFEDGAGSPSIRMNDAWLTFMGENIGVIGSFAEYYLAKYLQARNPGTPGIVGKLRAPAVRQLALARSFWNLAREGIGKRGKLGGLRDIYSGNPLGDQFSIDHFLPWSFVAHDLLWNLVPTEPTTNSSKNDALPDIEIYLPKLASLHFTAIGAMGNRPKFLEDYTDMFKENAAGLLAIGEAGFLAKYREVILPQAQIARNQGFPADWKFRGQP